MRLVRLAVPILALALALPALPATAAPTGSAAAPGAAADRPTRSTIVDSRRDVWRIVQEEDKRDRRSRTPSRRVGDVRTVRTLHTAGALVVRTRMADLGRLKRGLAVPAVQLRMPRGLVTGLFLDAGPDSEFILIADYVIDCPGAVRVVRPVRRAVELTIPRSCLGDPGWVRTRAITAWIDFDDRGEDGLRALTYVDVAPGPRLKIRQALSTRAWSPAGAEVRNAAPPVLTERIPRRQRAVLDLLARLG